jgi:NTP pyrophosphatase (non-canonical NTP hydrolase)
MNKRIQDKIICDILLERERQVEKHGKGADIHTPERWLVILLEEVGEVSTAILEKDPNNYREELTHVAAVALAAIENYDSTKE